MILVNPNVLIGDAVTAHNVILELASKEAERGHGLYLLYNGSISRTVLPYHSNIISIDTMEDLKQIQGEENWAVLDVSSNFHKYSHEFHMVQAYYAQMNLEIPEITAPKISFNVIEVPQYDYVISPFSKSDHKNNKVWPLERWNELIPKLNGTVAIIGGPRDYIITDLDCQPDYYFSKPLDFVLSLILKTKKTVITMDNGISHLCHGLGITNHALLYPEILSDNWVKNPNAKMLKANPPNVSIDDMLTLILSASKIYE